MPKNIHDKTFAQLLSERQFFETFLKTYLPLEVQTQIAWNTLKLYKMDGRHIQEKTQQLSVADVIYLAKINDEEGLLWVHLEHQTTPDRFMIIRAINYQTAELLNYIKINKVKLLPPIISIIYYQGQKPYPFDLELSSLFDALGLKYFAKPLLIDLPAKTDQELNQHGELGIIELLLKHIRRKDFVDNYQTIIARLENVQEGYRKIMIKYLIEKAEISRENLVKTLVKHLPKDRDTTMTAAEELRQEGFEKGLEQGLKKLHAEKLQVARALLLKGLSIAEISQITKLSKKEIEHLQM